MKATSPSHNIARGAVSGPGQSGSANPAANLMIEDLDEFAPGRLRILRDWGRLRFRYTISGILQLSCNGAGRPDDCLI